MSAPTASVQPWGVTPDGQPVSLYTLAWPGGPSAQLSSYGAALVRLFTPDRDGRLADVVLGHDQVEPYFDRAQTPYFGATIGRCANRIARGQFRLDGQTYQLPLNDGPNSLHGGEDGFDRRLWRGETALTPDGPAVTFARVSPDGEEGYPGVLEVQVTYTLLPDALRLDYRASTDRPTLVNLTHHSYWNLTGDPTQDVLRHRLQVNADAYTPVGETLIPTGELRPVAGTPFDFRTPREVGERIGADDLQLRFAGGYDHNFALREGSGLRPAAELSEPRSGRTLTVFTSEPGLQVYSGNFLDGRIRGKGDVPYGRHGAVCLEPQHFPDAPNQPHFPGVMLRPGECFHSSTVYAFGTRLAEAADDRAR